jgi:16S rRNA processing protein RimM
MPEPRYLLVGQVLRPHGVRGEVKVRILTDYPERLRLHTHLYLGPTAAEGAVQRYTVEAIRIQQDTLRLKLDGCDDRNAADALRGLFVQIPLEAAVPLEEGEYYYFQLIGVQVETEDGQILGEIVDVIETGANDVFVVRDKWGGEEVLLPDIPDVILALDIAAQRMTVRPLPGMLPERDKE